MILLLTSAPLRQDSADAIADATGQEVITTASVADAGRCLRSGRPEILVCDCCILESYPDEIAALVSELDSTFPLFPNLAICGTERLISEIQAGLGRRELESRQARKHARLEFASHFRDDVTAILLQCDLALRDSVSPLELESRIRHLQGLALHMRERLGTIDRDVESQNENR